MHSSTSSSDERFPRGGWGRTWFFATVLSVALLRAWDAYWVDRGFEPVVTDEEAAWVLARERVEPASTVMIGTSRIQSAIVPSVWAEVTGREPVQLAIVSSAPTPILENLARDEAFRGVAVVDVIPEVVFDPGRDGEEESLAMLEAARTARVRASERLDARIRLYISRLVTFRQPALSPGRLIVDALEGRLPQPPNAKTHPNRFLEFDFDRMDVEERRRRIYRAKAAKHPPTGREVDSVLQRLGDAAARIHDRGGLVFWIHLPRCDEIRELEQTRYPRAIYWDRLAATWPSTSIHTEDYEVVERMPCPDGSHIDPADAPAFTRLLATEVLDRLRAVGWSPGLPSTERSASRSVAPWPGMAPWPGRGPRARP